jgi:3-deoxy-manno-octulosonate cytidylyltransferase (CMP-KDO synthetase)
MNDLKCIAIIPARYASTRFPGKPLAEIAGRPMIQHVYERVSQSQRVSEVLVATDDWRIEERVRQFGGNVCRTSPNHSSGTDRVAEVALRTEADLIVNVQGDEPLIDPHCVDAAIAPFFEETDLWLSTLMTASRDEREWNNPNVVKVVVDYRNYALYFSRAPLPYYREGFKKDGAGLFFKHIGLYVYRRKFLNLLPDLVQSRWEKAESLEQLRFLENGYRIKVVEVDYQSIAVDTPEDLVRVQEILGSC